MATLMSSPRAARLENRGGLCLAEPLKCRLGEHAYDHFAREKWDSA